jgi:hypothetical protein
MSGFRQPAGTAAQHTGVRGTEGVHRGCLARKFGRGEGVLGSQLPERCYEFLVAVAGVASHGTGLAAGFAARVTAWLAAVCAVPAAVSGAVSLVAVGLVGGCAMRVDRHTA